MIEVKQMRSTKAMVIPVVVGHLVAAVSCEVDWHYSIFSIEDLTTSSKLHY